MSVGDEMSRPYERLTIEVLEKDVEHGRYQRTEELADVVPTGVRKSQVCTAMSTKSGERTARRSEGRIPGRPKDRASEPDSCLASR